MLIDPVWDLVLAHARMSEGNDSEAFVKQEAKFLAAVVAAVESGEKPSGRWE